MLGAAPAPTASVCSASTKYSAGEHKIYSPLIGVSVLNTLFYNAAQQSCTFLFWKKKTLNEKHGIQFKQRRAECDSADCGKIVSYLIWAISVLIKQEVQHRRETPMNIFHLLRQFGGKWAFSARGARAGL